MGDAGRAVRRAAGDRDADPEHQPGQCRARAAAGEAGLPARRSVHLRARAVHDRYGEARRRRAAGDDVPGARRHLQGRRQPAHHAGAEADRAAGRAAHQSFRHRGTGQAAGRRRHAGLRHDRARAYRHHAWQEGLAGTSTTFREQRWADLQPPISRTAHFLKGFGHPDGKFRFRPDWTAQAAPNRPPKSDGPLRADRRVCRNFPTMSI